MLEKNIAEKFNIPENVFLKIDEGLDKKFGELISIKIQGSIHLSEALETKSRAMSEQLWKDHEIDFLKQGTTQAQVYLFCKGLLEKVMQITIASLMDFNKT